MRPRRLIAALAAVAVLVAGCGETACRADGGKVMVHKLTGNKWCDMPPHLEPGENLFDLDVNDYLID